MRRGRCRGTAERRTSRWSVATVYWHAARKFPVERRRPTTLRATREARGVRPLSSRGDGVAEPRAEGGKGHGGPHNLVGASRVARKKKSLSLRQKPSIVYRMRNVCRLVCDICCDVERRRLVVCDSCVHKARAKCASHLALRLERHRTPQHTSTRGA